MNNKEQAKIKSREWRKNNREKHRSYSLKYQKDHKKETNQKNQNWKNKNREKVKEQGRKRHKQNPKLQRNASLKYNYGITYDQYEEMSKKQNHSCAICKRTRKKLGKKLAVDHNHITGKIRALLCITCNLAIGYLFTDKNTDIIKSALNYCEKHK